MQLTDTKPCRACRSEVRRTKGEKPSTFTARHYCDGCDPEALAKLEIQPRRIFSGFINGWQVIK